MRWLFDLSVRNKILFLTVLLLVMMGVVGGISIKNSYELNEAAKLLYSKEVLGISNMQDANVSLIRVERTSRNILLAQLDPNIDNEIYKQKIQLDIKSVHEDFVRAEPHFYTEKEKANFALIKHAFAEYEQKLDETLKLADSELSNNMSLEQRISIRQMLQVVRPLANKTDELIKIAITEKEQLAQQASERTSEIYQSGQIITLCIIGCASFLGILIGHVLGSRMGKNAQIMVQTLGKVSLETEQAVEEVNGIIEALSRGDLSGRMQSALRFQMPMIAVDRDEVGLAVEQLHTLMQSMQYSFSNLQHNINTSLEQVDSSLEGITQATQALELGKFSVELDTNLPGTYGQVLRGVANTMRELNYVVGDIKHTMDKLSNAQFDARVMVDAKGDLLTVKEAINKSVENLQTDVWLKDGISALNNAMLATDTLQELASAAINQLARYLPVAMGALYLFDSNSEKLTLAASYVYMPASDQGPSFALGEGVIGQVARERKAILMTNVAEQIIQTGTTHVAVLNTYTYPLVYKEQLLGVVELASHTALDSRQFRFLTASMENLGAILYGSIQANATNKLLKHTQQLATELEQQRVELEEQTAELEKTQCSIEQQNVELAQTQIEIKRQNDELQAANSYKSEFLANMSHELRTPLNSINILSSILAQNRTGNLSVKQTEQAMVIHQAGADLLQLINDILDLAKLESKKVTLHVGQYNLHALIQELHSMFSPIAEDKGIILQCQLDADVPSVIFSDQEKIRQVLKNFISNALKFTSNGGMVTLGVVMALPEQDSKLPINIFVKDTGIGIPEEKFKAIFEAFQQVDGSTSRKYGGTGLGLSISRELANLLSGEISVSSVLGQGAKFTLSLPLKLDMTGIDYERVDVEEAMHQTSVVAAVDKQKGMQSIPAREGNAKQLLIIEDDAEFAKVVANEAEILGFACLMAFDGERGVQLAKLHQPRGIILDMNLPGLNGMEVLKQLKADTLTRHIPVKIIACDTANLPAQGVATTDYLQKPVPPEVLHRVLSDFLDNSGLQESHLLLVEDDNKMLLALNALLAEQSHGVSITSATTGAEAIQAVKSAVFDVAIVDLGLPDMSGFSLLEELKQCSFALPIIVYSGRDFTREELRKINEYSDAIVLKTVGSTARLLDEVRPFLQRMHQHKEPNMPEIIAHGVDRQYSFAKKKILLVDDDMRNVFALSGILEDTQAEIITAENGQEALDVLNQHPDVDIVLMDMMMPVMDGYEAIKAIRLDKSKQQLPIIAVTAKAQVDDRQKCLAAGANDYLSKPINAEQLLQLIMMLLG